VNAIAVFLFVGVVSFLLVMVGTRSTAGDRNLEKRIAGLKVNPNNAYLDGATPEFLKQNKLSSIGWWDKILQRWNLAHSLRLLLIQAESSLSVSAVLLASVVLGMMGFAIASYWIPDLIPDLVLCILSTTLPVIFLRARRNQRISRFEKALPDALDLLTRSLRAGHSTAAAIEIVSEESDKAVRSQFREVYKQQNFGMPYREALLQLAQRVPSADLRFVVTAMLVQKETGGNLVEILERTAEVLRDRVRVHGEVRIYTAQGRLTGWILSLLPVVMFILINIVDPGYTKILLEDPLGRRLLYMGASLMALGGLAIRKIVNVKV
jgi:tight adherence protein B